MAKTEKQQTDHEQEIEGYRSQLKALNDFASQCRREAEGAQKEVALVHGQFADLKERLHDAEIDNAVMRGYLDRVAEDDHATDGFFEVADGNGEVTARPKRKGHGYRVGFVGGQVGYAMGDADTMTNLTEPNRPKRRVHWTSY